MLLSMLKKWTLKIESICCLTNKSFNYFKRWYRRINRFGSLVIDKGLFSIVKVKTISNHFFIVIFSTIPKTIESVEASICWQILFFAIPQMPPLRKYFWICKYVNFDKKLNVKLLLFWILTTLNFFSCIPTL